MEKIIDLLDGDTDERYIILRYETWERLQRLRAHLQGLAGMKAETKAQPVRIECTPEQWADLQEWIGPLECGTAAGEP